LRSLQVSTQVKALFSAPLSFLALSGCATLPEYRDDNITTADVVLNIKCEMRDAVWRHPAHAWLKDWDAGFTLQLNVFHKGGATGNASLVVPLNPGTFTIALDAGADGEATRNATMEFSERLNRLRSFGPCPHDYASQDRRWLLEGELGIRDWLERVALSQESATIFPKSVAYSLEFIIRKNGGVKPSFSMIPVGRNRFGGDVNLTGSRRDTHKVSIALAKHKEPEPQKVVIVDDKRKELQQISEDIRGIDNKIEAAERQLRALPSPEAFAPEADKRLMATQRSRLEEQVLTLEKDKARKEGEERQLRRTPAVTTVERAARVGPSGVDESTQRELDSIQSRQLLRDFLDRVEDDDRLE
jgi:hypothetical protein